MSQFLLNYLSDVIKKTWWPIAVGSLFFWAFTGGSILDPQYISWLSNNDAWTAWLGWSYFRQTPLIQWPLGANWPYGMELSSSIVYSDSLPLFALIFKPFDSLLPINFQYFGLWIYLCCIFQIYFAQKLCGLYLPNLWQVRIATLFFGIAPIMLWRLHGHYALFGQWIIVLAWYLFLKRSQAISIWAGVLSISALVHAYFLAMLLAIWGTRQIQLCYQRTESIQAQLIQIILTTSAVVITMWMAGYFMVDGSYSQWGFGFYRLNLNAAIDPDGLWSWILGDQFSAPGDYEGFAYFGLGILLMTPLAIFLLIVSKKKITLNAQYLIVVMLCALFTLFAVSDRIAFGQYELFNLTYPGWFEPIIFSFRNSGRFFWPVYYLIYLAVIVVICRKLPRKYAIAVCILGVTVQGIDSSKALAYFRNQYNDPAVRSSFQLSPSWKTLLNPYDNIVVILPRDQAPRWQEIAWLGSQYMKKVNVGYWARSNERKTEQIQRERALQIMTNQLSPNTLYIFDDTALWAKIQSLQGPDDLVGMLDGLRIYAPNYFRLVGYVNNLTDVLNVKTSQLNSNLPRHIKFTKAGDGQRFFVFGWSEPELLGTWSNGQFAQLALDFGVDVKQSNLSLIFTADAFLTERYPNQEVRVYVNNQYYQTWFFSKENSLQKNSIDFRKLPMNLYQYPIIIDFEIINPIAPAQIRLSDDRRRLGLRLQSLEIVKD